jgi:hypothetical protein
MKDSKKLFKRLGLIGIGLCAACCLLPIGAALFSLGAFTLVSSYVEWVGAVAVIVAATMFGIYYFRKKQAPACDVDCACKEDKMLPKVRK